eukprot:TRINITY_DN9932_c0_g1_i1.p1 TRINITY_DN9932_c0_g1~~TRINITY_DN9932_c0_g1_i1.p1  ORF type:complete len:324 (-),score=49.34 TRINITY_DN9932_c0_g1_i1:127-1098(-)
MHQGITPFEAAMQNVTVQVLDLLHNQTTQITQRKDELDKREATFRVAVAQFEKEKDQMAELLQKGSDIVELNVGGRHFTTSRSTLCSRPNSKLEAMFSGRWKMPEDKTGKIFLDRDGKHFKLILEFLRNPDTSVKLPAHKTESFRSELEWYGLGDFINIGAVGGGGAGGKANLLGWTLDPEYNSNGVILSLADDNRRATLTGVGAAEVLGTKGFQTGTSSFKIKIIKTGTKDSTTLIGFCTKEFPRTLLYWGGNDRPQHGGTKLGPWKEEDVLEVNLALDSHYVSLKNTRSGEVSSMLVPPQGKEWFPYYQLSGSGCSILLME